MGRSLTKYRPAKIKHIASALFCCVLPHNKGVVESELGEVHPMTLREYVKTLPPYDPRLHGWRGDEPRRNFIQPSTQSELVGEKEPPDRKARRGPAVQVK